MKYFVLNETDDFIQLEVLKENDLKLDKKKLTVLSRGKNLIPSDASYEIACCREYIYLVLILFMFGGRIFLLFWERSRFFETLHTFEL